MRTTVDGVEAGPDRELPVLPAGSSSGWEFNWRGALPVLLIAAVAVVGWRWLEGAPVGSEDADATVERDVSTTEPTVVEQTSTTGPRRSTTTTSLSPAATTTVASEPRVLISGEMRPCRFGSNCLVASFSLEGFDEHPGVFTCVYPNSRTDRSFGRDVVDEACLTGDEGDTISIEVDGVKSATISERNLDGN